MKDKFEIGKLIQEARKKKGYTQIQLAEKLNVSNKAISHWEKGRYYPDYEYFNDIAKVLDINLNEYLKKESISKKKTIKIIVNIVLSLILMILIIYFINNYNQFALYKVTLDNENIIINNGFITKTKDNLLINLGELENQEYLYQPPYKLTLYHDNNKLISINNYTHLTYQTTNKDILENLDKLYIQIEYSYLDMSQENININFKLTEISNSNNLINKKVPKLDTYNINQENLLLNNGYYKTGSNIYIKQNKDAKYKYDINKKILSYKEETITASYDGGKLKYIIVKDNKIIEEYDGLGGKFSKTYSKIFDIMKDEFAKIRLD